MSATNRGPRVEADNYPTPAWCTRRILEALCDGVLTPTIGTVRVIEPCCGEGAIVNELLAWWPNHALGSLAITSGDIRNIPGAHLWDATRPLGLAGDKFDLLITNPPFALAHEIIQAQRRTARVCCYLLRRNWLGAGARSAQYRNDMPDEYLLPDRPSFIVSSKCVACSWSEKIGTQDPRMAACPECFAKVRHTTSDMAEYSWFVWDHRERSEGRSIILPSTPMAERKVKR